MALALLPARASVSTDDAAEVRALTAPVAPTVSS